MLVQLLPKNIFVVKAQRNARRLYLSFDDGPTPGVTEPLLDLLAEHDVKATFFVIGQKLAAAQQLGMLMVDKGHVIGNHSFDHKAFGRIGLEAQQRQVIEADKIIAGLKQGYKGFRAPQGLWSVRLIIWLYRNGYQAVHWSYDSLDYHHDEPSRIVAEFTRKPVSAGDIILFHDDHEKCIEALKTLIPMWKKQGFTFETLDNLE